VPLVDLVISGKCDISILSSAFKAVLAFRYFMCLGKDKIGLLLSLVTLLCTR